MHYSVLRLLAPGARSKVEALFFLKVIMLHIKFKGMEYRAPCKHIFCPYTHPRAPGARSKGRNIFFLKAVPLYIKLKGMERRALCKHIILFILS